MASQSESGVTIPEALAVAIDHHRQGRLREASIIYQRILEAEADQPDALHYLGVLYHQLGQGEQALSLLHRAAEQIPDHPDLHNNLGNVLKSQGRREEAVAAYRRALALRPADADTHNNLGVILKDLGRLEEAVQVLEQALTHNPRHGAAHYNLAQVLHRLDRFDAAARHYRQTLELKAGDGDAYRNLAAALYCTGNREQSREVYREWLHVDPNPLARHMLAALSGEEVPQRASDGFVKGLFDASAPVFDQHLTDLHYRAPQYVAAALNRLTGEPRKAGPLEAVLDAGCGTGLCGPLLRPLARRLVGVDLSPGMLERARQRGDYDQLLEGELTAFLEQTPARWQAIVSADTLVYFGALEAFAAAAHQALTADGLLIFTVEKAGGDRDYRLNHHGRYSHNEDYLHRILAAVGFEAVELEEMELRMEAEVPVVGYLVTARRP